MAGTNLRRPPTNSLELAAEQLKLNACEIPPFGGYFLTGGRSSMVELQIVVLAVAGSSPVGRPLFLPLKRVSVQKVWADCGQLQRLFELSRGQTPLAA